MGRNKVSSHIMVSVLVIVILVIGVPLIINWCYSCNNPIIYTKWDAAEVLSYYGSVLGALVAAATFAIGVGVTISHMSHQQNIQLAQKTWQEVEEIINNCLDEIHPSKLQYAFIDMLSERDAYKLFSETVSYRVAVNKSVDKIKRSISRVNDRKLKELVEDFVAVCNELLEVEKLYSDLQESVYLNRLTTISKQSAYDTQNEFCDFALKGQGIEKRLQMIYKDGYTPLTEKKEQFFKHKYETIFGKLPTSFLKLIWDSTPET